MVIIDSVLAELERTWADAKAHMHAEGIDVDALLDEAGRTIRTWDEASEEQVAVMLARYRRGRAMIRVELITTKYDGTIRRRHDCEHRHRSLKAAKRCAKSKTVGVPAKGGENLAVVYEGGEAVAQMRVLANVTRHGHTTRWCTRTSEVVPGSSLWLKL